MQNDPNTPFDERKIKLTAVGHQQWQEFIAWPWTNVLRGIVNFSLLYFGFSVGAGRMTVPYLTRSRSSTVGLQQQLISVYKPRLREYGHGDWYGVDSTLC